jgi:hypothetical protein
MQGTKNRLRAILIDVPTASLSVGVISPARAVVFRGTPSPERLLIDQICPEKSRFEKNNEKNKKHGFYFRHGKQSTPKQGLSFFI